MPNKNQFVVTATRQQTPVNAMDIDFTADYDPVKPLSSQLTSLNSPATGNNGTTATPAATSSQKLKVENFGVLKNCFRNRGVLFV